MKLIDRYTFTNGKAFETWYLDANDTFLNKVPECDVIGLRSIDENGNQLRFTMMRPDEALIQARMLIDAVHKATSGYEINLYESHDGERREVFRAPGDSTQPKYEDGNQPAASDLVEELEGGQ